MVTTASDPKGYYTALELARTADAAAVKAAYRARAKVLHPDHNNSADAASRFQHLNESYLVLSNIKKRAVYDAECDQTVRIQSPHQPQQRRPPPSPTQPAYRHTKTAYSIEFFPCSECGRISAQPRYIVFERVRGLLLRAIREPVYGIYCPLCAERVGIRASMYTWARGWWGVPFGPIYSVAAIVRNMFGGYLPKDANARILLHQAKAFLARGDQEVARAIVDQASGFCIAADTKRDLAGVLSAIDSRPRRRLKGRWTHLWRGIAIQASPMVALLAILFGLFHAFGGDHPTTGNVVPPAPKASPASPTLSAAVIEGTYHVTAPKLNVRGGPGIEFDIVGNLERFTTVTASGRGGRDIWVHVIVPGGISGYVAASFLAEGPGWKAQLQWCRDHRGAPIANGTLLLPVGSGQHHLVINNTTSDDVLIKLKAADSLTRLALYVHAHESAEASGITTGTFQVLVATGKEYSQGCGVFLTDMRTVAFPQPRVFQPRLESGESIPSTLTLTLRPPNSGYPPAETVPEASFVD